MEPSAALLKRYLGHGLPALLVHKNTLRRAIHTHVPQQVIEECTHQEDRHRGKAQLTLKATFAEVWGAGFLRS